MKLSITINTYQDRGFLRQLLWGIRKLDLPFEYEVMVIDSGSADGTAQMVREEYPWARLHASAENIGHQRGHNIGFQNTSGEYILSLNADIVFLKDSITPMIQFLDSHPEAALVSPKLVNPDHSAQKICLRYSDFWTPFYRRTFLGATPSGKKYLAQLIMEDIPSSAPHLVERVQGSCMMIRRSALLEAGNFDERFFLYYGDEDLCRRLWQMGWKVFYLPEVEVIHYYHRESNVSVFMSLLNPVSRAHLIDWCKDLWKWRGQKTLSLIS